MGEKNGTADAGCKVPVHRTRERERKVYACVQREKEPNEHVYNPGSYFSLYTFILH